MPSILYLVNGLHKKYPSALTIGFGFDDKSFLLSIKLFSELTILRRQQPRPGKEMIIIGGTFSHIHETKPQQILS
jgi:hypothetical protein